MSEIYKKRGMGWLPDYPDLRDYTVDHDSLTQRLRKNGQIDTVKTMLKKTGVSAVKINLPKNLYKTINI